MIDTEKILQLVQKYNQAGPRYTSYPTAPEWDNEYGQEDYVSALKASSSETDEPLSLYVHYPFCRKLCYFCGCNKVISRSKDKADAYLDRVEREIDRVCSYLGGRKQVTQVHWGGGTPSLMTIEQTQRSFEMLTKHFNMVDGAEIAMELDPRTTSRKKVQALKSLGFNRISYGVQDLNDDVQRAINRDQSQAVTRQLYEDSRAEGFEGVNLDLVYGLPKQTLELFQRTAAGIIDMRPDRVAMYSYAHLPKNIPAQRLIDEANLPEPSVKFDMYLLGQKLFLEAGYLQIGMDHFVLPDDELAQAMLAGKLRRNFMGYTVEAAQDWIGFGMSSISFVHHDFAQNISKIKPYQAEIDEGQFPVHRGLHLSKDDLVRQFAISELMCNFRLDHALVSEKFSLDSESYFDAEQSALTPFSEDGLLKIDAKRIQITDLGKNFIRNIAMVFDAYLKREDGQPKHQFSKTI